MENQLPRDTMLYKAVVTGDCSILEKFSTSSFCFCWRALGTNDNIIHLAIQHEHCTFVEQALGRYPELIFDKNSCNETPFHIAAKTGNINVLDLLVKTYEKFNLAVTVSHPPWRVKNLEGNTPLHVALMYSKLQFATKLVKADPKLACLVNNSAETPLHLAIKHRVDDERDAVMATMKLVANVPGATFVMRHPREEEALPVIKLLLNINKGAACARDANGLTPVLIAASLNNPYVSAIKSILNYCPASIKVCDSSGKTMLHLLNELPKSMDHEDLLRIPDILALKDYQDFEGNTPAHIAAKNRNIFMVQVLLRMSANFAIKNKAGVSAACLIQQQIGDFQNLVTAKAEQLQIRYSAPQEEKKLVRLHTKLTMAQDDIVGLIERTDPVPEPECGSLQHWLLIACYYSLRERNALTNYMKVVFDNYLSTHGANTLSGNPFHTMVRWTPEAIDNGVLQVFQGCFEAILEEAENPELYSPPWMMKDKYGNTPLHLAVLHLHGCSDGHEKSIFVNCIKEFLKFDSRLTVSQNNNKETPLHLLSEVTLSLKDVETIKEEITVNMPKDGFLLLDKDGLTPVLRAAHRNNFDVAKLLCDLDECSSMSIPKDGKTLCHLLAEKTPDELARLNLNIQQLVDGIYGDQESNSNAMSVLYMADRDGNTPLHIAIQKENFGFAEILFNSLITAGLQSQILSIRNKEGVSPGDMIGNARLPREFENFLWRRDELVKEMLGVRSLSGVPTGFVKGYINTIGVIAALLATITFTAAFTVPGGLNPYNGAPLLMRRAAFRVFLVSDILALCLSMMILFFLLSITGIEKERVVLLDLVIFLLKQSFYATLVAFMTGLYVTTISSTPWVAILACALCSMLILVMRDSVVISIIRLVIKIFILSRQCSLERGFLCLLKKSMICCIQQPSQNNEGNQSNATGEGGGGGGGGGATPLGQTRSLAHHLHELTGNN